MARTLRSCIIPRWQSGRTLCDPFWHRVGTAFLHASAWALRSLARFRRQRGSGRRRQSRNKRLGPDFHHSNSVAGPGEQKQCTGHHRPSSTSRPYRNPAGLPPRARGPGRHCLAVPGIRWQKSPRPTCMDEHRLSPRHLLSSMNPGSPPRRVPHRQRARLPHLRSHLRACRPHQNGR